MSSSAPIKLVPLAATGMLRVLLPHTTVLMVCDVQECFRPTIYGYDDMCYSIRKMLRAAGIMGMPVLATEQKYKFDQQTAKDIEYDSVPADLNLGVFEKEIFSMMIDSVRDVVLSGKYDSIILVGAEAHACILQTALDALRAGLGVYILADAVSSCNRAEIPLALSVLKQAGAVITTSESILFRLVHDTKDERFAKLADLVKDHKDHSKLALKTFLGQYEAH